MNSSFYSNTKKIAPNSFIFDKTYANRKAMDAKAATDGVYVGRYVLVDYGERYYTEKDTYDYIAVELTKETYEINKYYIQVTPGVFSISKVQFLTGIQYYQREEIPVEQRSQQRDSYLANQADDQSEYKASYDSTVWQKINVGGTDKYILVAELNAIMPAIVLNNIDPISIYDYTNITTDTNGNKYLRVLVSALDKMYWHPSASYVEAYNSEHSTNPIKITDVLVMKDQGDIGNRIFQISTASTTGTIQPNLSDIKNASDQFTLIGFTLAGNSNQRVYCSGDYTINANGNQIVSFDLHSECEIYVEPSFSVAQTNELVYYINMPTPLKLDVNNSTIDFNETGFTKHYLVAEDETPNRIWWENFNEWKNYSNDSIDTKLLHIDLPRVGNDISKLEDILYGYKSDGSRIYTYQNVVDLLNAMHLAENNAETDDEGSIGGAAGTLESLYNCFIGTDDEGKPCYKYYSDWTADTQATYGYIKNKPTYDTIRAEWTAATNVDLVKNTSDEIVPATT